MDHISGICLKKDAPTEENIKNLLDALQLAILTIESYQMDIRDSDNPALDIGFSLAEKGFCQGSMYLTAKDRILRVARGELKL